MRFSEEAFGFLNGMDTECDTDDDCSTQKKEEAKLAEERQRLKWQKDHMYDDMLTEDQMQMSSNQDRDEDFLDDFM